MRASGVLHCAIVLVHEDGQTGAAPLEGAGADDVTVSNGSRSIFPKGEGSAEVILIYAIYGYNIDLCHDLWSSTEPSQNPIRGLLGVAWVALQRPLP